MSSRVRCPACGRPQCACYCRHVTPVSTRTKVLILQHPRESRVAINTARIARLCLPNSDIRVGIAWGQDSDVAAATADPSRTPILLYPGEGAKDITEIATDKPVTLVVIDGTWSQSRAVLRSSRVLADLPRYAFVPSKESEYRIRREPRPEFVSTIEAVVNVLEVLEQDPDLPERLLRPFRAMVDFQLGCVEHHHTPRARLRPKRKVRAYKLPADLVERRKDLLCVVGEANAWPRRAGSAYHSELVHWLAYRPFTGERFECVRAPQQPVSPATPERVGLGADELLAGVSPEAFEQTWHDFVRQADVLCSWGYFPLDLLRGAGGWFPAAHVDLRATAKAWSGRRWPTAAHFEQAVSGSFETAGRGRGGQQLGRIAAIARFLAEEGKKERGGDTIR